MRQAGRYLPEYRRLRTKAEGFLELCYTPNLAAEITLQPLNRFSFDAAILFSDILVIPHALGQNVSFVNGEGPKLERLLPGESKYQLIPKDFLEKLSPVYSAIKKIKENMPENKALIGFAGSPWTVATYMIEGGSSKDFALAKRWAYAEPKSFSCLIDNLVTATILHLRYQIKAGIEVLQLFDSWAGILSPTGFNDWVIEPTRKIVEAIKSEFPQIPIIGFPRGAGERYIDYISRTSVDGISLDTSICTEWAAERIPKTCVIQGNLDPQHLVVGGPSMVKEVEKILYNLKNREHIFNLGHGIVPETPTENVNLLIETVQKSRL